MFIIVFLYSSPSREQNGQGEAVRSHNIGGPVQVSRNTNTYQE